jgi:hypothetical protein
LALKFLAISPKPKRFRHCGTANEERGYNLTGGGGMTNDIGYANDFRHALAPGEKWSEPTPREVESFVYLTELFIRLAMP